MVIDQLLFGYQDGHRQLAGSAQLSRDAASLLLGATDALLSSEQDRLLTGMPLSELEKYAFSVTWSAPEAGRPGAVWTHTLLIEFRDLADLQPASLLQYVRRPQGLDLENYQRPIQIDPASTLPISPDLELLNELLFAGTDPRRPRVVVHQDLRAAEETLLALWNAQWPSLRTSFAFRTRDTMRATRNPSYLAVARQIRGMSRPPSQPEPGQIKPARMPAGSGLPHWLARIGDDPQEKGTLRRFLLQFGPDEMPELRSFAFLGGLFESVAAQNPRAVVTQLEQTHPNSRRARGLKVALLGPGAGEWWSVPEVELVEAVLGTKRSAFDPRSLSLTQRLQELIRRGFAAELAAARARRGPKPMRAALLDALSHEATTEIVIAVHKSDAELAFDVLRLRPDLVSEAQLWARLSPDQARATLSQLELTTDVVVAAARGSQFEALLSTMPFAQLVKRLAYAGPLSLVRQAVRALPAAAEAAARRSDDQLLLMTAAGVPPSDLSSLLDALEHMRETPNEVWLRSGVFALSLAKPREIREALEVVFGPLHHAITDDRLPHDLWPTLDRLLPKADDPSLRLRRFLVSRAKEEQWVEPSLERALRDSGPHIGQLRQEVREEDDEVIWKLVKSGLKSLKRLGR